METPLEQIREQQKQNWNRFSPGWKKWDELNMNFLQHMTDAIISYIKPKDGETILDVAAGTGEPALTLAAKIGEGTVIITDLSEGMLDVARENALVRGITNIDTQACDVCDLPFPDNTFDAISCRLGFMFFPDMLLAAKQMFRVLKPGGRIAAIVWDATDKNLWVSGVLDIIGKHIDLPKPTTSTPGMLRCAERGLVAGMLQQAGFKNVSESELPGKLSVDSASVYWSFMTEVITPVITAMAKADDAMKAKIQAEVFELMNNKSSEGKIALDSAALIIYGEK